MRKYLYYVTMAVLMGGLTACPLPEEEIFSSYTPVYMSRKQLEASVEMKPARPITNPGKIYLYGNYILINEQFKGVHVVDNRNPAEPQNVSFLQAPGNVDFAVKANVLYLDNAVDLVAVDMENPQDMKVTSRIREAFPPLPSPDNFSSSVRPDALPKDAVIVEWEQTKN